MKIPSCLLMLVALSSIAQSTAPPSQPINGTLLWDDANPPGTITGWHIYITPFGSTNWQLLASTTTKSWQISLPGSYKGTNVLAVTAYNSVSESVGTFLTNFFILAPSNLRMGP